MWGSSFAELAKKAQALQEQASSLSAGELFNLDAMQSQPAGTKKPAMQQQQQQPQPPPPAIMTPNSYAAPFQSNVNNNNNNNNDNNNVNSDPSFAPAVATKPSFSLVDSTALPVAPPISMVKPPIQQKGKLKFPAKSGSASSTVTTKLSTTIKTTQSKNGLLIISKETVTEEPTIAAENNMVTEEPEKPPNVMTEQNQSVKQGEPAISIRSSNAVEKYVGAERSLDKEPADDRATESAVPTVEEQIEKKKQQQPSTLSLEEKPATDDPNDRGTSNNNSTESNQKLHEQQQEAASQRNDEAKQDAPAFEQDEAVMVDDQTTKVENSDQLSNETGATDPKSDVDNIIQAANENVALVKQSEPDQPPHEGESPEPGETSEQPVVGDGSSKDQIVEAEPDVADKEVIQKMDGDAQKSTKEEAAMAEIMEVEAAEKQADGNDAKGQSQDEKVVESPGDQLKNSLPEGQVPTVLQPTPEATFQQVLGKSKNQQVPSAPSKNEAIDSERVMHQFTAQLQRLEANFETERKEMQKEHSKNIQNAIAAKEKEMEQLKEKMKEKDLKLRELRRIKEGNELRMDSLKREVEGIKELLEQRDAEIEKLRDLGNQDKHQLEQKIRSEELTHARTKQELKAVKDELQNVKRELDATNDEFTALKSRVKVVAGELKERRVECRDLKNTIEELEQEREKLQEHIANLESQLSDRDRSGTEKDEEVGSLRATIESLEQNLKEAEKDAKSQEEAFEKNLATYKKKAQSSLAVANARAASAAQDKEIAEMELRAVRSAADATMERARAAEENGQKAMKEAKEYYREMEEAKEKAVGELEASKSELDKVKKKLADLNARLELAETGQANLAAERAQMARDFEMERSKSTVLRLDLDKAQLRVKSLETQCSELRNKLQIAEAAAAASAKKNGADSAKPISTPVEDANSRATIILLQKQLKEANHTIEELKEALENAIVMGEKSSASSAEPRTGQNAIGKAAPPNNGNDAAPLFYAMEKQAELNTARNEINRLASLFADVQSEKVEAEEMLKATQKELAEEKAKLQRYEKLSSSAGKRSGSNPAPSDARRTTNGEDIANDPGRTNIEYLKNIMLSFLNAKTLTERKSLVPVIGAVLCLTPEEQAKAIQNVEATGGIEGFGSALFETFGRRTG